MNIVVFYGFHLPLLYHVTSSIECLNVFLKKHFKCSYRIMHWSEISVVFNLFLGTLSALHKDEENNSEEW